ncbi:solute carrier family 45 member 3 [Scleropages formosus]|uniref:Zgc:77158 n=1 Tax=Scleropages formosus TaxID=113540 RepID=A0A8C9SRX9_SCLFO|nr:solute carrier family 45 member 3-like [Scleropages formosus]XP_018581586.2 solute carrier family 45 member 3-like [Scleropages formosus]XP_018581588.2 solute carrier family 45 member 3-like [Scleropages formosus]
MPGWKAQWRLLLLNSLTCGLELCVAAGITYVPPLLLEAGVEEQYMTMVLGIGPVLGLLFIPLIGSASDRCTSSYGRRRPFIWLLSLGVLLSLLIIPHADVLASQWGRGGRPLQLGLLILGVGLLDFCGQVCFTPLEALLSDLYGGEEEEACSQAFAMFSFMVSLGGCVGYLLPALDWSEGLLSLYLGGQEECLFTLLILIFVPSVLVTMKVSEETPHGVPSIASEPGSLEDVRCVGLPRSCFPPLRCRVRQRQSNPLLCLLRTVWSLTPAVYRSYCHIPPIMRQLCAAQLCSWMAVMSFMLFYTDFVGEGLYEGVPSAAPGTASRQRYDEGIRMGSLGLFLQCATSTVFSLAMSRLVRLFGSRRVYLGSVVSFTACALVICLSKSVVLVTAMSALTGFAYAALQTLPYALTCHYHKEKEVYMPKNKLRSTQNGMIVAQDPWCVTPRDGNSSRSHLLANGNKQSTQDSEGYYSPLLGHNGSASWEDHRQRGVGLDFALLDSTFLLSQVFPTLFMGMIVQFTESVTTYIASSAIFGFVAIYLANQIVFEQKDIRN